MFNVQNEISRELPQDARTRSFTGGNPILYAFGCALLERETETGFIYTAVNLTTGKSEVLSRRMSPLSSHEAERMAERIYQSRVAGASRFAADRSYGQRTTLEKCREILHTVFRGILPKFGYTIRKEQIALADSILNSICRRTVTLAEAEEKPFSVSVGNDALSRIRNSFSAFIPPVSPRMTAHFVPPMSSPISLFIIALLSTSRVSNPLDEICRRKNNESESRYSKNKKRCGKSV